MSVMSSGHSPGQQGAPSVNKKVKVERVGMEEDQEAVNLAADWADISQGLRKDLGQQAHSQWIRPIQPGTYCKETGTLDLYLPTEFSANWVADRFADLCVRGAVSRRHPARQGRGHHFGRRAGAAGAGDPRCAGRIDRGGRLHHPRLCAAEWRAWIFCGIVAGLWPRRRSMQLRRAGAPLRTRRAQHLLVRKVPEVGRMQA